MRHSAHVEKWDLNGTWNVSFPAPRRKTPVLAEFLRIRPNQKWDIGRSIGLRGIETKMGHGVLAHSTILFRGNPPNARICSQIGPKHGDSCLGANCT